MMDPRDLLRTHGAPTPLARPMPTEIRSDGGLQVNNLIPPYWAGSDGNPVIAQWRYSLPVDQVLSLRRFLVEPDPATGIQQEAAINQALIERNIGNYLGTFVNQGPNFAEISTMITFRSNETVTEQIINQRLYDLISNPVGPVQQQAAKALKHLRTIWGSTPVRNDARLMMLSQVDLLGGLADPAVSPFSANMQKP